MASKEKVAISKSNPVKFGKYLFYPGAKLEAMDFLKNWYQAKVIKVKEDEQKVLVHFDGWNQRYDEWMPFSSEKIRPLMRQSTRVPDSPEKLKVWSPGDSVKARWSDAKFYQAEVVEVQGEGMYKVRFFDGFEKVVSGSSLKRNKDNKKLLTKTEKVGIPEENKNKDEKKLTNPLFATVRSKRRHVEPVSMADFVTPIKKVKSTTQASTSSVRVGVSTKEHRQKQSKTDSVKPKDKKLDSASTKGSGSSKFTSIKQKKSSVSDEGDDRISTEERNDSTRKADDSSTDDSSPQSISPQSNSKAKPILKVKFFPHGRKSKRTALDSKKSKEDETSQTTKSNDGETSLSAKSNITKESPVHSKTNPVESPKRSRSSSVSSSYSKSPSQEKDITTVNLKSKQKQARLKYTKTKAEKSKDTREAAMKKKKEANNEVVKGNVFNSLLQLKSQKVIKQSDAHSSFSFSPEDDVKLSVLKKTSVNYESNVNNDSDEIDVVAIDSQTETDIKSEQTPVTDDTVQVTVLDDNTEDVINLDRVDVVKDEDMTVTSCNSPEIETAVEVTQVVKRRRVRSRRPRGKDMEIASMVVQEWPSAKRGQIQTDSIEPQSNIAFVQPSDDSASATSNKTPPQIIVPKLPAKNIEYFQVQQSTTNRASPSSFYSSSPDVTPSHSPMTSSCHQAYENMYDCRDPMCTLPHQRSPTPNTVIRPPPYFAAPYGIPSNGFDNPPGHFPLMPAPGMVGPLTISRFPCPPDHTVHYLQEQRSVSSNNDIRGSCTEQSVTSTANYNVLPMQQPVDSVALLQITKVESHASTTKLEPKGSAEKESGLNPKVNTVEFKVKKKRLDLITNKLSAQKKSFPNSAGNSPSTSPVVSRSLSDPEIFRPDDPPQRAPQVWPQNSPQQPMYNQYPVEMGPIRMPVYHNANGMPQNINLPAAARLMSYASAYREFTRPDGSIRPMTVLSTKLLYPQPPIVAASSPRSTVAMPTMMYPSDASRPAYALLQPPARPRMQQGPRYTFHPSFRFGPYEVPADPNYYPHQPLRPPGVDQRKQYHTQPMMNRNENIINARHLMMQQGKPTNKHENDQQPNSNLQICNPDVLKYMHTQASTPFISSPSNDDKRNSKNQQQQKPEMQTVVIDDQSSQSSLLTTTTESSTVNTTAATEGNIAVTNTIPTSKTNSPVDANLSLKSQTDVPSNGNDESRTKTEASQAEPTCRNGNKLSNDTAKRTRKTSEKTLAPKEFVVQVDLNEYKCPVENCDKSFRKSQLLEYHIKYYHSPRPEDVKRKRTSASLSSPEATSTSKSSSDTIQPKRVHHLSESHDTKPCSTDVSLDTSAVVKDNVIVDDNPSETGDDSTLDSDGDTDSSEIDDVIRCKCHAFVEQGFMIQCEQCLTWQHGDCVGLSVSTVPSKYLCYICSNPRGLRKSAKYTNDYDWYRMGKLPTLLPRDDSSISNKDECKTADIITATHALLEDIHNIEAVLRSIQLKLTEMSKSLAVEDLLKRAVTRHAEMKTSKLQSTPHTSPNIQSPSVEKQAQTSVDGCNIAALQKYLSLLDDAERLEKQLTRRFDTLEQHINVLKRESKRLSVSQGRNVESNNNDELKGSDLYQIMMQLNDVCQMVMTASV